MQQKPAPYRVAPFPFEGETQTDFEHAVRGAALRTVDAVEAVHCAVNTCVRQLKLTSMQPEGVLVTMRAYLAHTARSHFPASDRDSAWALTWLAEQVAKWTIEAYYSDG